VRAESWNGLQSGDAVIVAGLRMRGARWEFRAHVYNRKNGSEVVEVVGGRVGDRKIRSFDPDRIFAVPSRKKRGGGGDRAIAGELSLAEAPQLPLE
jgi:hypothetical protein